MNKKNNAKKLAALVLGGALATGCVGCGNFIVTDNEKDLAQVVANVDITSSSAFAEEYGDVATDVKEIVKNLSTKISKRELVAYFLNTGYQYVQSYGYTYEDTFNMLMNGLVSREVMIQYAIAYYLKNNGLTVAGCNTYVDAQKAAATEKQKVLYEKYPEVLTLKYFLTSGGADEKDYKIAVYNLAKSTNDSLDSLEKEYIKAEAQTHDHGETRTLPNNVTTEKEDYYNDNYGIYTGRNTKDGVGGFGEYEKQYGSTTSTRQKAYNAFLANLQDYNMVSSSGKKEDTSDIYSLEYYYVQLSSMLEQSLINQYFEILEDKVTAELKKEYMQGKYDELKKAQEESYKNDPTAFATEMGNVSDDQFLLYGLDGFGYVYNILLPFSTSQNMRYTEAKNNSLNTETDLFNIRKEILKDIKAQDLRGSWICAHDDTNYSYKDEDGKYYFFKDNLSENARYESLVQYAGIYPYNGTVTEKDGELEAKPAEGLSIDEFIALMEKNIDKVVTGNDTDKVTSGKKLEGYDATDYKDSRDEDKIDYSKFMYYKGTTTLDTVKAKDYFDRDSDIYKAISAVNELMFAYSTDTGCLNTYLGYAVSPYKTDFVKEFEYAAREAIKGGAGTYVVCATDYGWHIVYASFVYKDGDVYGGYDANETAKEGSFSNLFYESVKSVAAEGYSTEKQNEVLNRYNNKDSVTLYKSRYQDLLDMDA